MRLRIPAALVVAASCSLAAGQTSQPLGARDARGREATPAPTLGKRAAGELGGGVVHQPRGVVPNDACTGAITLAVPSTTQVSTEGAEADAVPSCAGASLSGPGVWYGVVGTGRTITLTTCAAFTFDTQLSVYCGSCAGLTCVTANDDACSGGGSSVSFCSEQGRGYFVLVHGYAGASGTCTLSVTQGTSGCGPAPACGACTIDIPQDAVGEGEQACGPGYVDSFNGGCDSTPARYSQLAVGQAVSGRAGTFVREGLEYRDTDWYEFTLESPARVTWAGAAEFPFRLGLIDGNSGCRAEEVFDYGTASATGCQAVTLSAVLPAGRYIAWAGPSVLTGVPCGSRYFARLTATPAGACTLHATAGCALLTPEECATLGGAYQGDGTACAEVNYFVSATTSAFESIASTGTVAAVGEDAGVVVPLGFTFGFYNELRTQVGISPNGYLSFGGSLDDASNGAIPDPSAPNGLVAPRWDNLAPAPGSVRYETRGSAPTRRFIVQWTSVPQFGLSVPSTFQTVLFEADGSMEFRYLEMAPARFAGDFTTGVEDGRGARGVGVPMAQVAPNSALAFRKGNLVAPVAVAGGPYVLRAAAPSVMASARASYDPDGAPGFGGIASVQWDLGGDGTTDDAGRTNADQVFVLADCVAHALALEHPVVLRLAVTDADGLGAVDATEVRFESTAPTADAGGTYPPIGPGDCLQVHGVIADPDLALGVGEVVTAEWDTRPAASAAEVGDGFALGADACIPYATLASIAAGGSDTIYLNVRDRAGGVATSAARFALVLPDLEVTSITAPAAVLAGQQVQVSFTVRNSGEAPATGPWVDGVWLSGDAVIGNDVPVSAVTRPVPVGSGQAYTLTSSFAAPLTPGTYWLVVRTDTMGEVLEASDANNVLLDDQPIAVSQGADLVVDPASIAAPSTVVAGSAMHVQFTVRNGGGSAATGSWQDRVLISAQAAPGGDVALGTAGRSGPLGAGASYVQSADPVVPLTEEGLRYVVVVTDAANTVVEGLGESNNRSVRAVPVMVQQPPLPDLVVATVTAPTSGTLGDLVTVRWHVDNRGGQAAGGQNAVWFDRVYFSVDRSLNPGDIDLGPVAHTGSVAVNGGYDGEAQVRLPGPPGAYYVLVHTNSRGDIEEGARRDNNVTASGSTTTVLQPPRPDLSVAAVAAPAPAAPGDTVEARWTVRNTGQVAATSQWVERVYASSDAAPGNDVLIGSFIDGEDLEVGQSIERTHVVPVPDIGGSGGAYHLVVCVDALNSIDETDEANNCAAAATASQVLRPDLQVAQVSAPAEAQADEGATVRWTVVNESAAPAQGTWLDSVYMRPEGQPTGADVLLGSQVRRGGVGAQGAYQASLAVQVPGRIQGAWRFFVVTDSANAVIESNESNNQRQAAAPTQVHQPGRPNLVVTSIGAPKGGLIGGAGSAIWRVRNVGQSEATGSWADRVIARNIETNEETVLAEAFHSGAVAVDGEYEGEAPIEYPAPEGMYRLSVITDRADSVNEGLTGGELDNRATDDATFEVSTYNVVVRAGLDQAVAGTTVPITGRAELPGGGGVALARADVTVTVRNQV